MRHLWLVCGLLAANASAVNATPASPAGVSSEQIYFGTIGSGGQFALALRDGHDAVLAGYVFPGNPSFVVNVTIMADGSFTAPLGVLTGGIIMTGRASELPAKPQDTTLVINGVISGGTVTGSVSNAEVVNGSLEPAGGPTAAVAGSYRAPVINSRNAEIDFIVGTSGKLLAVSKADGSPTQGTLSHVSATGDFSVMQGVNQIFQGSFDAATHTVAGQILLLGQTVSTFYGVAATVTPSERFVNISTRGAVGVGANVLIAGFVISGNAPKTVLIRGVGPALASYGVVNPLADPQLTLYQGASPIGSNDDWSAENSSALSSSNAGLRVGAFPLAPGSKDAALLITLAPGVYSAQVAGAGGATGLALLEIYELP